MSIVVPSDLAAAIEAGERTPLVRVMVDWDGDGFGPAGSIDDLSGRQGAITITRSLTTDLPDPVRLVEGSSAATGTVQLAEGDPTDETMHPARYYTRGSDAPLGHHERINRPTTVDIGFITASGPQYVRRLTGVLRKMTTVSRGRSAAAALLDNRALLRNTVTLIPTNGNIAGANGTWIVTQALYANGIGAGPLPRPQGSLMWLPMYGSISPIRSDRNPAWLAQYSTITAQTSIRPPFMPGPFAQAVAAAYSSTTNPYVVIVQNAAPTNTPAWSQLRGRLEMWCLGVTSPTASSGVWRSVLSYTTLACGLRADGHMYLRVLAFDMVTLLHEYISTQTVPGDGAWHAVGVHWDITARVVQFRIDGVFETQATTILPTELDTSQPNPNLLFNTYQPVSDVHVHDIDIAASWLADTVTVGAVLDPSLLNLVASYESTPREAWDLITEVAQAEQAVAAFDELGVFRYRTRIRLVDNAGQTAQRVLSTADGSLLDAQIDDGIDQVRNIVQVSYSPVTVAPRFGFVYRDQINRAVPAQSVVDFPVTFTDPLVQLQTSLFNISITTWLAAGEAAFTDPYFVITVNADFSDDANADFAYAQQISAVVLPNWTPASATVRVTNLAVIPLYITNIGLKGLNATVGSGFVAESRDQSSISKYGPQPLQLTASQWVQSADVAQSLAAALLGDIKDPHPTVSGLSIVGDPRRQLGDRVVLADPDGTQLAGEFWLTQFTDQVDANGAYTQSIAARGATTVARYGVGRYGVDTYGRSN